MADDGLILNFAVGDDALAIKSQVKFTGGRWRDRVKAQKSVKKWQQPKADANAPQTDKRTSREDNDDAGFPGSDRPNKRQRTDYDTPSGERPRAPFDPSKPPRQIASKLFSYNPTATTVFDTEPAEEVEPARPSNAPLTEGAENFHALGLSKRIAQHLSTKLEMKAPTSIQKNTIPKLVAEDSDAFLQAETGSGKTLAYLLPIVQRIMALSHDGEGASTGSKLHRNSGLFAIILGPTRELCKQISVVLEKLLRCAPWIVSTTVIGGESKHSEKARLRKGVNILVATPGRLTDHLDNTKVLDAGTVRWLVLDEGDRMMEMGFEDDLKTIVGKIRQDPLALKNKDGLVLGKALPTRRVTILCSATMKMNVQKLGEISLEEAIHITAAKDDTEGGDDDAVFAAPSQLKQTYLVVPAKLRLVTLIAFLKSSFARKGSVMKAIIFMACADSVDFHFELLKSTASAIQPAASADLPASKDKSRLTTATTVAPATYITSTPNPSVILHRLHGSLAQAVRTSTLQSFTDCKDPAVLITTDISSRGLDVPSVDLVIEYDPAFSVDDHVHRIGRTARAGRPGKAALFLLPGCEEGYISLLPTSPPITAQSYDTVLQKGFATAVDLPPAPSTDDDDTKEADAKPRKQSPNARAEALQLHIEQRLLAYEEEAADTSSASRAKAKGNSKSKSKPMAPKSKGNNTILDSARQGFRSHIRAYATHVREERGYFDIAQLHLGHMAKAYGLREAPGGIGGGVQRRTHTPHHNRHAAGSTANGGPDTSRRRADDGNEIGGADEDAARRMRQKMKMVMSAASEFNIG